jgi:hypothetical protein
MSANCRKLKPFMTRPSHIESKTTNKTMDIKKYLSLSIARRPRGCLYQTAFFSLSQHLQKPEQSFDMPPTVSRLGQIQLSRLSLMMPAFFSRNEIPKRAMRIPGIL